MVGHAIRWDPVPPRANQYMLLGVERLTEEAATQAGAIISLIVTSTVDEASGVISAWRITFESVVAYSMHPMQSGRDGITLTVVVPSSDKDEPHRLREAAWEIVHSQWLADNSPHNAFARGVVHHYVLADYDYVYEVAALGWSSEQLDESATRALLDR